MLKFLRQTWSIALMTMIPVLRVKSFFLQLPILAILPLYFILMFGGDRSSILHALAGGVVTSSTFLGLGLMQDFVYEKHYYKLVDMLVSSPLPPSAYVLGKLLGSLLLSLPSSAPLMLLLAHIVGYPRIVTISFLTSMLLGTLMGYISFAIATLTATVKEVGALPGLLGVVLLYLPPVYYPCESLPLFIRGVVKAIPTVTAAEIIKHYSWISRVSQQGILLRWTYLTCVTLALAVLSIKISRWREP